MGIGQGFGPHRGFPEEVRHTRVEPDRPAAFTSGEAPSLAVVALRWKGVIAAVGLLAGFVTYLALLQIAPTYTAKTQVMLEPGTAPVINIPNVVAETDTNLGFTESAVIVMQSTDVLRAVVEELELDKRKEFNPALQSPKIVGRIKSGIRWVLQSIGLGGTGGDKTELIGDSDQYAGTIRELRKVVSVRVLGESRVLEVHASSTSPRMAAAIANSLAKRYIDRQLETKFRAGGQATQWLQGRADELREVLLAAEQRSAEFRESQIADGQEMFAELEPQLATLTESLVQLTAEQAELEARRDEITRLLAAQNFAALSDSLDSPITTELNLQLSNLEAQILRVRAQFGEHATVQRLREARELVETRFRTEVDGVLTGLNVRIDILAGRRAALERQMEAARRELADRAKSQLQLAELERDVEASREVYNQFLLRLKETRERSQFQSPDAWIISEAQVPVFPTSPQKSKLSAIAAVAGGGLALLFLAFFGDNRPKVVDPRNVAQFTGVDSVREIPRLRRADSPLALWKAVSASPSSPQAAVMALMHKSLAGKDKHHVNVIMVTSVERGEGKSAISLSLAEAFAQSGAKTALVNADPGNDEFEKLSARSGTSGLCFDYVDCTDLDEKNGPDQGFSVLLDTLKRREVIIIDVPPVLWSPDALEIGMLANSTIVACAWDQTPNENLARCIDMLREAGVAVDAIAINKAPRAHFRQSGPSQRPVRLRQVQSAQAFSPPQSVA